MSYAALPVLGTPRLTLRPLAKDDAGALVAGAGNYDVSRWLAVVPYPYEHRHAVEFIETVHAQANPFWALVQGGAVVGVVSIADELGYWLARPAWGKGLGFEAARAATDWWFAQGHDVLVSGYFEGNERSGRVLASLGFRLTGQERRYARAFRQDVVSNQMILTREDWAGRRGFTVYTPRLTLRPLAEGDADAMVRLARPEVARNLFKVRPDWSVEEATDFIRRSAWAGWPHFRLAIERGGEVIGYIGCVGDPPAVVYALTPGHWGQGLATEALSAFLPEVFARFPLSQIEAAVFEDNPGSSAILAKFGFQASGRRMQSSLGRLEPAPAITYALNRNRLRVPA